MEVAMKPLALLAVLLAIASPAAAIEPISLRRNRLWRHRLPRRHRHHPVTNDARTSASLSLIAYTVGDGNRPLDRKTCALAIPGDRSRRSCRRHSPASSVIGHVESPEGVRPRSLSKPSSLATPASLPVCPSAVLAPARGSAPSRWPGTSSSGPAAARTPICASHLPAHPRQRARKTVDRHPHPLPLPTPKPARTQRPAPPPHSPRACSQHPPRKAGEGDRIAVVGAPHPRCASHKRHSRAGAAIEGRASLTVPASTIPSRPSSRRSRDPRLRAVPHEWRAERPSTGEGSAPARLVESTEH